MYLVTYASGTSYHHTSFASMESLAWQVVPEVRTHLLTSGYHGDAQFCPFINVLCSVNCLYTYTVAARKG